jgi:hypothetical protein
MGRRHIWSDHPGNGPRTMILRKFASTRSAAKACKPFLVSDLREAHLGSDLKLLRCGDLRQMDTLL